MRQTSIQIAIGVTALLLAVAVAALRSGEIDPAPGIESFSAGPAGDFCLGIEHPRTGIGLVCVERPGQLIREAIRRLNVPAECASVALPRDLRPGDRIILDTGDCGCELKGIGVLPGPLRLICGQGLDINRDSAADLALLPGIGETKARLIVESRKVDGPFDEPDDLKRIRGIGPKTVKRIRPWLDRPDKAPGR